MTELEKDINNFLEGLVHKRFSEEELNKTMSDYFKHPVEVSDITKEDDEFDFNLLFGMDFQIQDEHIYGYVDLYFLKMRNKEMYITEVAVEFE